MAAITVAAKGVGVTLAAANGGGDTVTPTAPTTSAGGWNSLGGTALIVAVGATPTIVSVDGVATGPAITSKTIAIPLSGGVYARSIPITYDQVTNVTVGAHVL